MVETAAPKKRKLDHDWTVAQLNDVAMDEASKSSVGSLIQQLPEDDLRKASAETLSFYLHEVGDLNVRRIVAVRLHHRIQDLQPPSAPAPWLKHNQYVAPFPFLGLVVSFLSGS